LKAKRVQLKTSLHGQYMELSQLEDDLKNINNKSPAQIEAMQKVFLMKQVLSSQLGLEKVERGQEGMLIHMLNDKLNVVGAINCKGGLDRTGFWHAAKLAMLSQEKIIGKDRSFALVRDWEKNTEIVNRLNANLKGKEPLEKYLNQNASLDDLKAKFGDLIPPELTDENFADWKEKMGDVLQFRKMFLKNLIEIGIPITVASTGMAGIKWNSGYCENLIPLNFIPAHIAVGKNETPVSLIKYDEQGRIKGLTRRGKGLIAKFNEIRGS